MKPRFTSVFLLLVAFAAGLVLWLQRPPHPPGIQQTATAPESARHDDDELEFAPAPTTEERERFVPGSSMAERPTVRSGHSRGRLVDERTLEPIPDALVVAGSSDAATDADGWFDVQESLDELDEVLVLNVGGLAKHIVAREHWLKEDDHWRVPLAVGPTYRLWFGRDEAFERRSWDARLTWDGASDRPWLSVRASSPPYIRYDAPLSAPSDKGPCWIEARSRDGLTDAPLGAVGIRPCTSSKVPRYWRTVSWSHEQTVSEWPSSTSRRHPRGSTCTCLAGGSSTLSFSRNRAVSSSEAEVLLVRE